MNIREASILEKNFDDYVANFDMNDPYNVLRYQHSYRVMHLSELIASHLSLEERKKDIVKVIGLLHDYGRFPQWEMSHTYNDLTSVDHADLGVELLFDRGKIKDFWTREEDYEFIFPAIKYHNKYDVPNSLDKEKQMFCKIIRDADKIDILSLMGEKKRNEEDSCEKVSPKVKEAFILKRQVYREDAHTKTDMFLVNLALVFGLHYSYSFHYLKEHKIIEKLYRQLQEKDNVKYYFDKVFDYIEEKTAD